MLIQVTRYRLLFLSLPLAAAAQPRVGASLQFGAPLNGWFQDFNNTHFYGYNRSAQWMIGPAVEIRLTSRVALEAAGLYRQVGESQSGSYVLSLSSRERGYSWEFPIIARYSLPRVWKGFRPFLTGGGSVHWQHTHTDLVYQTFTSSSAIITLFQQSRAREILGGVTVGAGLERRRGAFRFSLESRVTFWMGTSSCSQSGNLRCVAPNQVAFLAGVGF